MRLHRTPASHPESKLSFYHVINSRDIQIGWVTKYADGGVALEDWHGNRASLSDNPLDDEITNYFIVCWNHKP